jgi:hydroxyacylglutathione hydrolase
MAPKPHLQTSQYSVYRFRVEHLLFTNYTYLLVDKATNDAAVIDPAWEPETIIGAIRSLDVHLKTVLLTHSHFDHVNLVQQISREFDPVVYMSQSEIDYYKYACASLEAIQNETIIAVGQTRIKAIHTPGHTHGSFCYIANGSAFTGDTLFTEGCGACDFDGGCPHDMFRSLQTLKAALPGDTVVYPGHSFGKDPGQRFSYLMQNNIYLNIDNESRFVDFRMRQSANTERKFAFQ